MRAVVALFSQELFHGLLTYHTAAKDNKQEDEIKRATMALMTADVDGNQVLDRYVARRLMPEVDAWYRIY